MIALLGVFILLLGLLLPFFFFGGLLSFFPGLVAIAMVAMAFVGWRNRGDIHAREHVLDMLPWMVAFPLFVLLLSLAR